jgi:hypothetical protein
MKKKLIKLLVATFLFINIAGVAPVAFAEEITNFQIQKKFLKVQNKLM